MTDINKAQLLRHIAKSDLTAVEKRYLEGLVGAEDSNKGDNKVLHAGWMYDEDYRECSNCGHHLDAEEWFNGCDWNFCPQCGAKMDGDD